MPKFKVTLKDFSVIRGSLDALTSDEFFCLWDYKCQWLFSIDWDEIRKIERDWSN